MIIPSSLQPLPTVPVSDDEAAAKAMESEAFVSDRSVRQLLVGPLSLEHEPTVIRSNPDDFVGRVESPFISLAGREECADAPAKAFAPSGPHPALAAPRRAAPPVPRSMVENGFGRHGRSERRLVIGMGVAAVTLVVAAVFSGFVPIEVKAKQPVPAVEVTPSEVTPVVAPTYQDALAFSVEEVAMP
ncbi:hypothetical protein [Haloferula rosea]|uniref:Uncharacterized protein n=1 Tax=Haloferula rosea TaxID=490093 RepID=A0A934R870_9BACT|nr:hypothetical protein [Haloferula rosea]MBK1825743.1 hypothetical protein [Haloferula rosea]